jgi:hypothetical protein
MLRQAGRIAQSLWTEVPRTCAASTNDSKYSESISEGTKTRYQVTQSVSWRCFFLPILHRLHAIVLQKFSAGTQDSERNRTFGSSTDDGSVWIIEVLISL